MANTQRVDRVPTGAHAAPVIGGAHLKPGELAGPGRRYGNLPGTVAAVVSRPDVDGFVDGVVPLVTLDVGETVLVAIARAVHLGAGADGARTFARVATGDREALRSLLADAAVREALVLTITADAAADLASLLEGAAHEAEELADEQLTARGQRNPDEARDMSLSDELFGLGEHPEGVRR